MDASIEAVKQILCNEFSLCESKATELLQSHPIEDICASIEVCRKKILSGGIASPAGYLCWHVKDQQKKKEIQPEASIKEQVVATPIDIATTSNPGINAAIQNEPQFRKPPGRRGLDGPPPGESYERFVIKARTLIKRFPDGFNSSFVDDIGNPEKAWLFFQFEREALITWKSGNSPYSAKIIFDVVRHNIALRSKKKWKISNSLSSDFSRLFMLLHSECQGFFEFRTNNLRT